MGLPSSGVMKASMIRAELKESGTWSINSPSSRKLAKVPSGVIKFSDFYGKSSIVFVDNEFNQIMTTQEGGTNAYWGFEQTINGSGMVKIAINCNFDMRYSLDYSGTSRCYEVFCRGNVGSFKVDKIQTSSDDGTKPSNQSRPNSINTDMNAQIVCQVSSDTLGGSYTRIYDNLLYRDRDETWHFRVYALRNGSDIKLLSRFEMLNALTNGWRSRGRIAYYMVTKVSINSYYELIECIKIVKPFIMKIKSLLKMEVIL